MREDILTKIRKHWKKYLPAKVKALREQGGLEESMQAAARMAQQEIERLRASGYQEHEAEEVALKEFVYLPPEPGAGLEDWEREELAELEREYQKNPPV